MMEQVLLDINILVNLKARTLSEAGLKPKLKDFQQNIYYQTYYTDSALYSYVEAFYVGFQFDKYNSGEDCFVQSSDALDVLYGFNTNM